MAAFNATRFIAGGIKPSDNAGINPDAIKSESIKKPCENCLTVWEKWNALPVAGKVFLTLLVVYMVRRK